MPRVNDNLTSIVAYLYPSEKEAIDGAKVGGTCFFVRVSTTARYYDYVVTNRHVVEEYKARFIRLHTHGKNNPIQVIEGAWEYHVNGDDIAACEFPRPVRYYYLPLPVEFLLAKQNAENLRVGLGDDLFMIGRFLNHDGKDKNVPVVRFGTIAMMPDEPILDNGRLQDSFLIEIRTIPGFSGSPVFVHIPDTRFKDPHFRPTVAERKNFAQYGYLERCIGIEWCRIKGETVTTPSINGSTFNIQLTSGMSGCIPSWKILELLMMNDKFSKRREYGDKRIRDASVVERTGGAARRVQQTTARKGEPLDLTNATRRKKPSK